MSFPRFIKVIINHFLSQHKSPSNLRYQHYHTIKDDGIVSRLKFVRIGEDYQEYGIPIPDMMLNDTIKQSKSYQMFLKYSTGQIPPKKSRGKLSQGKKTASKRVIKKKVIISTADNIIPDPDVALELGKSISLTKYTEEEAARQVHATHARIMTESVPDLAIRRPSDTMKALKESKKTSRRHPGTEGSSEGTCRIPGVPNESTVVSDTSSVGTESEYSDGEQSEDEEVDWIYSEEDDEKKGDTDDDKSIDLEMTDDEETKDEFLQGEEQVNDDEDEEMSNTKVEEYRNDDEENIDAAKADVVKTKEVKDDAKKAKLPPKSSSLSVSSGFGDQFLKLSSNTSLIGTVKNTTDAEINSLLNIKIQSEQRVVKLEKDASELKKINHSAEALVTLKSQFPAVLDNYIGSKFGDVLQKELQKHTTDHIQKHSVKPTLELTKIQTPTFDLKQESEKSPSEIRKIKKEQAEKQKMPKYTIKSTDKATLKEYDQKSTLYQTMHEKKCFNINLANHALYHALMMMMKTIQLDQTRVRRQTGEEPKSKSLLRNHPPSRKPQKVKLHQKALKLVINTTSGDVVRDDDQPQDTSEPKTDKTPNPEWFKQPLRPPTPDPEWNKRRPGHLTVAADYFFNNDLEFLKTSDSKKMYTTSITKTKVARYEIKGIENMVLTLWSTIKHAYDKDAKKGIKHWGERQGDFVDLHLNDIEDIMLLAVQHKLFHLNDSDIVDFIVALCMFTRSLIIKKRVKDLQLRVESYQKKLNIIAPQKTFLKIEFKELYTPSYKPPWIIDFQLGYNKTMSRRKWTAIDRKRSGLMIELIDKQIRERRIIQNLERLVGARELEMDYKLMTRTV
ncbi:hypothetical protein Tco_0613067 [Tanacetum coccineum]